MKLTVFAGCVLLLAIAGCSHVPGDPKGDATYVRPDQVSSFNTLFKENCAGCHGDGHNGASYDLANPVYQAWVGDGSLWGIIAYGEKGTQMPAFDKSAGGTLTDAQITDIVNGMRKHWKRADPATLQGMPPYVSGLTGNAANGQKVYQQACARCHQPGPQGIMSSTYLALVNDHTLHTLIVAGDPDIGMPDWRGDIPGKPLTDQDVEDVIAYMDTLRSQTPGQPYAAPQQ